MVCYIYSQTDYINLYKRLSSVCKKKGRHQTFLIDPVYGSGSVVFFRLSDHSEFVIMDVCFHDDLEIVYELPSDHFEIAYCMDGCASLKDNNHTEQKITKNTITLSVACPQCKSVRGTLQIPAGIRYVNLAFAFPEQKCPYYFGSLGSCIWEQAMHKSCADGYFFINKDSLPHVQSIFHQIYHCSIEEENAKGLFIESRILEIIAQVCSAAMKKEDLMDFDEYEKMQIQKIPDRMTMDFLNPPTLSELSKELGINTSKLKKGFKQLYGITIYGYHKKAKLQNAKMLLDTTDLSVMEIAEKSGYASQSQFGAAFKEEYGATPSEFRRQRFD